MDKGEFWKDAGEKAFAKEDRQSAATTCSATTARVAVEHIVTRLLGTWHSGTHRQSKNVLHAATVIYSTDHSNRARNRNLPPTTKQEGKGSYSYNRTVCNSRRCPPMELGVDILVLSCPLPRHLLLLHCLEWYAQGLPSGRTLCPPMRAV